MPAVVTESMSSEHPIETETPPARWLHRLAMLLVCLVWPLIWIGGLVTTYDAGMAVPDWPNTYGYNLFLYPYKTWLFGPFDLFIEHGHRLLGAVVGMMAIGIVMLAWFTESRRWVKVFAVGLLIAVIAQGLLGGMRVVLGDRTLAMVHGCFGPAFFALCMVMLAVTSRKWWQAANQNDQSVAIGRGTVTMVALLVLVSYAQLVMGAQLRHVQADSPPSRFTLTVALHVVTAFVLWLLTAFVWRSTRRCGDLTLSRPAGSLIGLVGIQILLGLGTWVVNYGWPGFLSWAPGATGFLLRSKGFVDSGIVTAHVATGALILGVATLELVRLLRIRWCRMRRELQLS